MKLLKERQKYGVDVTIVTWEPDRYGFGDPYYWMQLHDEMRQVGFNIKVVEENCDHYAIIDKEIVWYGNMNLLGKDKAEDNMIRVIGKKLAGELLELSFGD